MNKGFTLIELLVVVTIIVVLLALLVPAMDKAIYQAELAACGAQMRGVGSGALQYAFENRRSYFHRAAVRDPEITAYQPRQLSVPFNRGQTGNVNGYDDRAIMKPYLNIEALQCPLAGDVSLTEPDGSSYIYASYSLWVGWKYDVDGQDGTRPSKGMFKVGDSLGWDGERFNVLLGDNCSADFTILQSAHPELEGNTSQFSAQSTPKSAQDSGGSADPDASVTVGDWRGNVFTFPGRGFMDMNYLWDDGSVRRLGWMYWDGRAAPTHDSYDARISAVPFYKDWRIEPGATLAIPIGK